MPNDPGTNENYVFSRRSAIWRVNSEWTGLIYGPAAAILQIAHPSIAHGVARHSDFRHDTLGRLHRTLTDVNNIAFGTRAEAEATREKLFRIHSRVRGTSESGVSYHAFDQDLMVWVLATLIVASIDGWELVHGPMDRDDKQAFLEDMTGFGSFFGVRPDDRLVGWDGFAAYYVSMIDGELLGSDPICGVLARYLVKPHDNILSRILGSLSGFLPIETLPPHLLERLTLKSTPSTRARMRIFRRCFPPVFKRLPAPLRCYARSRRRLSGE